MTKRKKQARNTNGAGLTGIVCGNIYNLRHRRKLTLAKMAARTKFSASYVSTMEHHKRTPTIANVERFAKAYKVPAFKFFVRGAVR